MESKFDAINTNEIKASFIQVTTIWMSFIIFFSACLRIYVTGFEFKRLIIAFIASLLMFIISRLIKKSGFKRYYVYLVLFGFLSILINGAYNNGSFQAPVVAAILIIPIFSSLLLDQHGLKIGLVLNLILIFLFTLFSYFQISRPFNDSNSLLFYPIIYLSSTLITYLILRVYLKLKNRSESLISKMYDEIILKAQMSSLINLSEGMSHEINNPLTVIAIKNQKALAILKSSSTLAPEEKMQVIQHLEKVQDSTKRITKIVSSLFSFCHHLESGEVKNHNMKNLIDFSIETIQFRASAKNIQFKIKCPDDLYLNTQKGPIIQVLINLLNNSIDSVDLGQSIQDRWIEISVSNLSEKFVYLSVIDSGKKIPNDLKEKIFLPFFTTKDVGQGSGMGLSLSLGIMQSMGGDLTFDSQSNYTKFDLVIPRL